MSFGAASPLPSDLPSQIGPFRILAQLGEGSFGVVYKAERRDPVRQTVALKVLRAGVATKEVLARFELERRALAAMNHRCIAKVLDAGATASGEPWVAMELVEGLPLTQYCDKHKLSVRERLTLFQNVCDGVQHAHQKGVVHRDLKPGNVLVVREGDSHVPKILDFGLAKATHRDVFGGGSFATQKDTALGTLEYMSPEQAAGDGEAIDARSDVYSLGVMLYEVLCGELPFPSAMLKQAGELEARRIVVEEEPKKPSTRLMSRHDSDALAAQRRSSLGALKSALSGDLDWVVMKAMSKEPAQRYGAALALAADIGRHLAHEPLEAGPPSISYRARKFVRKYRVQCAAATLAMAALITGGVGVWWQREEAILERDRANSAKAEANANELRAVQSEQLAESRARDNEKLAALEADARREAQRALLDFHQLSGLVRLEDALAAQETLWPAWPDRLAELESWRDKQCRALLAMRPQVEATIAELRKKALPLTPEQAESDRKAGPSSESVELQRRFVQSLRRAHSIRTGATPFQEPSLPEHLQASSASALNDFAWKRVSPPAYDDVPSERTVFGEEAVALAAARAAVRMSASRDAESIHLDTLAWALLANGQDQEARARSEEALAKVGKPKKRDYEDALRELRASIDDSKERLAGAEAELARLEEESVRRRTWLFGDDDEGESARFLQRTLLGFLDGLRKLESDKLVDVERRISWAQQVGAATAAHPRAQRTWDEAREAIARADGVTASKDYAGKSIPIPREGWMGLVPIGMNPATRLWEFYDLRSAWDGKQPLGSIAIPSHKPNGDIAVGEQTGIVFVLLPGGVAKLGAQRSSPDEQLYDPVATLDEVVHEVELHPFLLARHELTQGQWLRLWTWDDAVRTPSEYRAGRLLVTEPITYAHPVEQVDWHMCSQILSRHGMDLPTEAQWEYGCRGGTSTPYCCAIEDLRKYANLSDRMAKQYAPQWGAFEDWDDGNVLHSPVGSYLANAYGLHDMHGNIWEWCRDTIGDYGEERPGDGMRAEQQVPNRCNRGGSHNDLSANARSAFRAHSDPSARTIVLGLRAMRTIVP